MNGCARNPYGKRRGGTGEIAMRNDRQEYRGRGETLAKGWRGKSEGRKLHRFRWGEVGRAQAAAEKKTKKQGRSFRFGPVTVGSDSIRNTPDLTASHREGIPFSGDREGCPTPADFVLTGSSKTRNLSPGQIQIEKKIGDTVFSPCPARQRASREKLCSTAGCRPLPRFKQPTSASAISTDRARTRS
ncbi:hypothetical protein GGQ74_002031 [Desulfobaculum xiamenense]|uniref:Uncharacterized protein n=1 Tax=Desulfobaculum xiamenense TaxID=995050 RepID=A0A846QJF2_9BACT|nr:hypothetical protein [Desulfobaculum xiamenense]